MDPLNGEAILLPPETSFPGQGSHEYSMPSESDGCDHPGGQNRAASTEPRHGI